MRYVKSVQAVFGGSGILQGLVDLSAIMSTRSFGYGLLQRVWLLLRLAGPDRHPRVSFTEPIGREPVSRLAVLLATNGCVRLDSEFRAAPRANVDWLQSHETMLRCRRHRFN